MSTASRATSSCVTKRSLSSAGIGCTLRPSRDFRTSRPSSAGIRRSSRHPIGSSRFPTRSRAGSEVRTFRSARTASGGATREKRYAAISRSTRKASRPLRYTRCSFASSTVRTSLPKQSPTSGSIRRNQSPVRHSRRRVVRLLSTLLLIVAVLAPLDVSAARASIAAAAQCTASVGPGIPPPAGVPSGIPGFHAAWYGQSGYPTLCPGDRSTATVAFYTTGTRGWVAGKMGEVAYLGTWDPDPGQDRATSLGGDGTHGSPATGWPRYNRVAAQPAPWVGPNQIAWFQFTVVAPQIPGTYRLSIRPLVEVAQWMEDYGVFWYVVVAGTPPVGSLPALPARWPSRSLEIGMTDGPNGAAAMRASAPFALRYQYLAGGVNTGQGWSTWDSGARFPTYYIQDSARSGMVPVFSYYQIRPSSPGDSSGEADGDLGNLRNAATMNAYYA